MSPKENYYTQIYLCLRIHVGAPVSKQADFVMMLSSDKPPAEFRFTGRLGFGGKYYREANRVDCAAEDDSSITRGIIRITNQVLINIAKRLGPIDALV